MSTGPINSLSNSYLQSILGTLQNSAVTANNPGGIAASSLTLQPDSQQLSPFAQMMSALQQLQQSDPAKYQQVTAQIATNLQNAANTAQADGNTAAANQLNQLSTDFTQASQTGELPNIQDVAQAVGGHHHHHHHGHHVQPASSDPGSSSSAASPDAGLSQAISAFQSNGTSSDGLNPAAIIFNTLNQAGISG